MSRILTTFLTLFLVFTPTCVCTCECAALSSFEEEADPAHHHDGEDHHHSDCDSLRIEGKLLTVKAECEPVADFASILVDGFLVTAGCVRDANSQPIAAPMSCPRYLTTCALLI